MQFIKLEITSEYLLVYFYFKNVLTLNLYYICVFSKRFPDSLNIAKTKQTF